ncbi:MAG TPA: cache domain-containing protein [Gaiellaceae bacterium]|nr:cache domain-containing protein [Gaiellaceae bacterium]
MARRWYMRRELHLLAALVVAVLTVLFAAQRAADGARSALDGRLVAAGAGADAAVVGVESEQLSAVRAIAFTRGVGAALTARDGAALNRVVTPLQANSTVPMVDLVAPDGKVLLAVRSKGAPAPVASRRGLRALTQALETENGARGGRLSELAVFRSGAALVTVSPILDGRRVAGAVLAMTPLADVLGRLAQEVGTDLTAYAADGTPLATTATADPRPLDASTARALLGGGAIVTRSVSGGHREKLGRLIVDHTPNAVLGVSLADDSGATGRTVALYAGLGILCLLVILGALWVRRTP